MVPELRQQARPTSRAMMSRGMEIKKFNQLTHTHTTIDHYIERRIECEGNDTKRRLLHRRMMLEANFLPLLSIKNTETSSLYPSLSIP